MVNNADVLNRYPTLAGIGGAEEVSSDYILFAEAEVNAFFAGDFTVPFSDNNITAKDFIIDLTYVRAGNLKLGAAANEMREGIYKRMQLIKDGAASMYTIDGTIIAKDSGTAWSNTMNYDPVFNMGETLDYQVDSDQL